MKPFEFVAKSGGREGRSPRAVLFFFDHLGSHFHRLGLGGGSFLGAKGWCWGLGVGGSHLPDTRLLAVHHRHVAGLAIFDELLLCLVELLGHEAHEGVVRGVSCSQTTRSGGGMPWFTLTGPIGGDARLAGKWKGLGGKGCGFGWVPGRASIHRGPAPFRGI